MRRALPVLRVLEVLQVQVLAVVAVNAQAPPQQPPTFRSGTQVVEVDVRVFDKSGHFVTDLKPEEIELTEDGAPQKIQSLTLVGGAPSAPAPSAPSAPPAPAPLALSAPLAPLAPSVWVFVFDTNHLTPAGLTHSRDAVDRFIAGPLHAGNLLGVVVDGKMIDGRLTTSAEEARAAVASMRMPGDLRSRQLDLREWPRLRDEQEAIRIDVYKDPASLNTAVQRACTDDPDACRRMSREQIEGLVESKAKRVMAGIRTATLSTLTTVDRLSAALSKLTGPKTIVFLSEGFVSQEFETELQHAAGQANRAGAHFYTIDARGLNKGVASSDIIDKQYVDMAGDIKPIDMQTDGTNSLAIDTGGIAIRNENNFGRALDVIQRDAAMYYVLGYSPANQTFDGKYRTIGVKVGRDGVKVRARRGYVALLPAQLIAPRGSGG